MLIHSLFISQYLSTCSDHQGAVHTTPDEPEEGAALTELTQRAQGLYPRRSERGDEGCKGLNFLQKDLLYGHLGDTYDRMKELTHLKK